MISERISPGVLFSGDAMSAGVTICISSSSILMSCASDLPLTGVC